MSCKLSNVLQDASMRKILFFLSHLSKNAPFYLKMDEVEFKNRLRCLIELGLVKKDGTKIKLTKLGFDAVKLDNIFLNTFFELIDLFLKDADFKKFFVEKSSLPCVYYDALSRAIKVFLYFVHLYNEISNKTCNLKERNLQSVLNHRDCQVCHLILLALEQDEVVRPVIKALR